MSSKTLSNLFLATGLAAVSGGMTFRDDMPAPPLAAGTDMRQWVLAFSERWKDFTDVPIYDNFRTYVIVANIDSEVAPSRLSDLKNGSSGIQINNITDGENNAKPDGITMTNLTFTYGTGFVSASFRLINSMSVPSFLPAGVENAWFQGDVRLTYATDDYFNTPQFVNYPLIKIYPSLNGQGNPSTPPVLPAAPSATYPSTGLGADYVDFTVSAGWFGLGSGDIQIVWSLNSDFSTSDGFGTLFQLFTGNDPNFATTVYVRARVIQPYVGPWSNTESLSWFDPRPDV